MKTTNLYPFNKKPAGAASNTLLIPVLFGLFALVAYGQLQAQATSPYSRYGLGNVRSNVFSANQGMGGISAAYSSYNYTNFANPASYASLTRTAIDAGANVDAISIQTKDSLYNSSEGSLSHLVITFVPKPDRWALSMGLLPYSNINYNFIQSFNDSSLGAFRDVYSGSGSLYQAYIGGAYKFKSNISDRNQVSIGFNVAYVFGKLTYQKIISLPDSVQAYSTRNVTEMNVSGANYQVGVQYKTTIRDKQPNDDRSAIFMTIGLAASGTIRMNAKTSNHWDRYDIDINTGLPTPVDSQESVFNQKSKLTMPYTINGGVMFGNELYWMAGAEFKYTNWSVYNGPVNNGSLGNTWRAAAGFQITPKYDNRNNYLARMQYRVGGYYGKSEIIFQGQQLNQAGGTVGLGFPFTLKGQGFTSASFNLAADIGQRGVSDPNIIRENYYRITFGFVLNDVWFRQRKFD